MNGHLPRLHAPRISEVQVAVASQFGLGVSDMSSPVRARSVARPRQLAMYLARELTGKSLPEIGRLFGDRDHTTVIHAIRAIEKIRREDSEYNDAVAACCARLARVVADRMAGFEVAA